MKFDTGFLNFKRQIKILFLASFFSFISSTVFAQGASIEKGNLVRVGWFESQFCQTTPDGSLSGYAYEYQQNIAAYTGWKYEYVKGSWAKLFEMLKKGEIDLLADVYFTDEHSKEIIYSENPMGFEPYYIFVSRKNNEITPANLFTLNGKKVGVYKNSYQEELFKNWQAENGISTQIVEYLADKSIMNEDLEKGKVDAVVAIDYKSSPVVQIGSSDFYFAISKNRPDLRGQLDLAMEKIKSSNRNYIDYLNQKYIGLSAQYEYLLIDEQRWLENHGTVKVGYLDDYLSFCGKDPVTGELIGVLADYLNLINATFKNADFDFKTKAYNSNKELLNALRKGEIDMIFPANYSVYDAENENILVTKGTITTEIFAILPQKNVDKFSLEKRTFSAVSKHNENFVKYVKSVFPNVVAVTSSSDTENLTLVEDGSADCFFTLSYRTGNSNNTYAEKGLVSVPTGQSFPLSFAVKRDSVELYSILNRAISVIPESKINAILTKKVLETFTPSIKTIIRANYGIILNTTLIILSLFILLIIIISINLKRSNQLNEQLVKNQKELEKAKENAENANKAKSTFLFNMSHDIRTPMNAIIGFTDLLEKYQEDGEKREDYIQKIKGASQVLLAILNNVLEMARIENGKMEVVESVWSKTQFVDSIYSVFKEMMEQKNIEFTQTVDVSHEYLYCDSVKLEKVYMNLLSNSYKYTQPGGKISIHISELPGDKPDYAIVQSVITDSGSGISQDYLPHIFEEFSRENNTTESKIEGTGLGMAIVKKLVEVMYGTIKVESEVGVGTKFILTIPHRIAKESDLVNSGKKEVDINKFIGKRILLVEDNELNAEIAREILKEVGFIVGHASDGVECLQVIGETPAHYYDAILMDIQMPRMNGYEAATRIRALKDKEKANIPILALTANAFEENKKQAMDVGMNGHLAKPINVKELLKALNAVIDTTYNRK